MLLHVGILFVCEHPPPLASIAHDLMQGVRIRESVFSQTCSLKSLSPSLQMELKTYMGSVEAVEMVLLVGPAAEVSVLRRWILQAFHVYLCLFFFYLFVFLLLLFASVAQTLRCKAS